MTVPVGGALNTNNELTIVLYRLQTGVRGWTGVRGGGARGGDWSG